MKNNKSSDKEVTTSVTLSDPLYKAAKHYAIENNATLKDVISDALKDYLSKNEYAKKLDQ